jgi:hypothetical protein
LRQKFEFLVEEVAELARPTDEELRQWLATHAGEFRADPQVAFRQVFLSPDRRGASTQKDAREVLTRLRRDGVRARTEDVGDSTMLPGEIQMTRLPEVASILANVRRRIAALAWKEGPMNRPTEFTWSSSGSVTAERRRTASIRPTVEREFLAERRQRQPGATYAKLFEVYCRR